MIGSIDKWFKPFQIQRSTKTTDSWGQPIQSWADSIIAYGVLRQMSGSESNISNRDTHTYTHRFYCRPCDIQLNDRIMYDGQELLVARVNDVMDFVELLQVDLNGNS